MRPFNFYTVGMRECFRRGIGFSVLFIKWVRLFWVNYSDGFQKQQERLKRFTFKPSCRCFYHQGLTDDGSVHNLFVGGDERREV